MIFFVLKDIDIHQSNLGPFRYLKKLDEIPFNKCVFFHFLTIMHNNIFLKKKPTTI